MTFPNKTPTLSPVSRMGQRAIYSAGLMAGLLALGGCVSDHGKIATLDKAAMPQAPVASRPASTASTDLVPGVMVARTPRERYSDPLVVTAAPSQGAGKTGAEKTSAEKTGDSTAVALDTPPAPQQGPANLHDLTMQPTTVSANNNSLFGNQQLAYAGGPTTASGSGSIVPQDMPVRRGIRPSLASVYSAPQPQPVAEEPVAAKQDGGYLLHPQHAPQQAAADLAYDPAEPVPATEPAPAATPAPEKKGFSLMRLLGRSGS
jgi:hypothetical protein